MVTIKPWKSTGKKLSETPIKMLIAQEMSSTFEKNETPPSIVAKLMGLNKLPLHQKVQTSITNLQKIDSYDCQSRALPDCQWQQQEGSCNHLMDLSSNGQIKNHNLQDEVCHENLMEKKLALVHQKFILAKRLATNEKLIQSKEFKDALEVLSSNRDLFLKFLEEPNCLFSKQLKEIQQIISLGSQTKRPTVRKLNRSFDSDHEKSMRKNRSACGEEIKRNVATSQPIKILVLKPSSTLLDESKTNIASNVVVSLPESRHRSGNLRTDDDIRSREVAMGITWQKQKDLSMQEDEHTLIHDLKSYSHQSHSAETSERQEAKKRLPERWALATLNAINHEEQDIKKISSTLGEILAIRELTKEEVVDRLAISPWVSCGKEQDTSITGTCLPTSRMQESSECFLKNITRLNSLQDAASHENIKVNEEISCTLSNKSILLKEFSKLKKGKSFKEKVSSLFFSRGDKLVRDKPRLSTSVSSDGILNSTSSSSIKDNNLLKSAHDGISDDYTSKTPERNLSKFSSPPVSVNRTKRHGSVFFKGIRSIEKLWKSKISRENFNQHSPISVLETSFQEELSTNLSHSCQHSITGQAEAISRSPLIGSLSRSTYSEKSHSVITATNSLKLSKLFSKEDKEQEQLDFIQKLISTSNLANESSTTVLAKSHSLDCPLDPILLDGLLEREGEEAKYIEKHSNQKLLFDFVSFSLKEIGYCNLVNSYPWSTTTIRTQIKTNPTVTEEVLCRLKGCFSEEENFTYVENKKRFVDNLVKKEVIRTELVESMWLEMYEFSKEIGEKMLEELFDDALADLIQCCLC